MGTRGAVGIICDGVEKVGYNHYDSYPDGLGKEVIEFIKNMKSIENLKNFFGNIDCYKDIDEDDFRQVWDQDNGGMRSRFTDNHDFLYDSLFCEHAYLINLDKGKLEYYRGFNKNPNARGRYANCKANDMGYVGVRLIQTFPLKDVFAGLVHVENDKIIREVK